MINFAYQISGYRLASENLLGEEVELCEWYHPIYNPSGHLGLKFEKNGQKYYFSFSPKSAYGISKIPFSELRQGREGHMIRDFEQETLLWGFRNSWSENIVLKLSNAQILKLYHFYIENKLTEKNDKMLSPEQIEEVRKNIANGVKQEQLFCHLNSNDGQIMENSLEKLSKGIRNNFKSLSDAQLYEIANMFEDKTFQSTLREHGQPHTTSLKTLNLDGMIARMQAYSLSKPTWAPCAGSFSHQPNTHNCSSIILDILYAGKMDRLMTSPATKASYVGALLGLLSLLKTDDPLWILAAIGVGWAGGRAAGGAYDGYTNVQHFFNMNAGTEHDKTSTVLGMRLLSTLMGAVIGMMKWGPFFPAYLTLPKNVVDLAKDAQKVEEGIYLPNKIR